MIKKLIFVSLLSCGLHADVIQLHSMSSLLDYINGTSIPETDLLVVFDIDDTIARAQTYLGSDKWFNDMIKHEMHNGLSKEAAFKKILPLYFEIIHATRLCPVEQATPDIIKYLQDRGIGVIALTARSLPIAYRTLKQLAAINIRFHPNTLTSDNEIDLPSSIYYKKGIIFCSGQNKGKALMLFLEHLKGKKFKKVIVIDDREDYIHAVHSTLSSNEIECLALHYVYEKPQPTEDEIERANQYIKAIA